MTEDDSPSESHKGLSSPFPSTAGPFYYNNVKVPSDRCLMTANFASSADRPPTFVMLM